MPLSSDDLTWSNQKAEAARWHRRFVLLGWAFASRAHWACHQDPRPPALVRSRRGCLARPVGSPRPTARLTVGPLPDLLERTLGGILCPRQGWRSRRD